MIEEIRNDLLPFARQFDSGVLSNLEYVDIVKKYLDRGITSNGTPIPEEIKKKVLEGEI